MAVAKQRSTKRRTTGSTKKVTGGSKNSVPRNSKSPGLTSKNTWLRWSDLLGVIVLVVCVLAAFGIYADLLGPAGKILVHSMSFTFGWGRMLLPPILGVIGVLLIVGQNDGSFLRLSIRLSTGGVLGVIFISGLFYLAGGAPRTDAPFDKLAGAGGYLGSLIGQPLTQELSAWGAVVVFGGVGVVAVMLMTSMSLSEFSVATWSLLYKTFSRIFHIVHPDSRRISSQPSAPVPKDNDYEPIKVPPAPEVSTPEQSYDDNHVSDQTTDRLDTDEDTLFGCQVGLQQQGDDRLDEQPDDHHQHLNQLQHWQLPPTSLLIRGRPGLKFDRRLALARGNTLVDSLGSHGVSTRLIGTTVGPTVTRYELELAQGVKVSKVTNLAKDIAYAMAAADVRILAPIPGKSAIGVEVPNPRRQLVLLGDVLEEKDVKASSNPLDVPLGRDISGRVVMASLNDMPHLLISGATGAGKSSCINSMMVSVLTRSTPDQLRLVLIDPKRVELEPYNGLPHLLAPVVVDPHKAAATLSWVVIEMERRYGMLAEAKVRDIGGYNAQLNMPTPRERLPYLLVVVDELNDLMMVAAREVEDSVCRIAQMARAVGIHLILATQRPSVDVITGLIKANIPSRLSFAVSSLADSRVILDQPGAERLVGKGDMLFLPASSNVSVRLQGPWVSEAEVQAVVTYWGRQANPTYVDELMIDSDNIDKVSQTGSADPFDDELLDKAMELVVRSNIGSTSMLQRKLRVGFARAGRLMDLLEQKGVVAPAKGSKAREVLMTTEELDALNNT
ncbi:MAG: DNA translocase FtsK [Actinobacteria bacterium]|nr:DNA translocase FtsK [Actinomycetota bacterium]MCL6104321.1 DNA translocase FtsK [Actinomycetota bacterium]